MIIKLVSYLVALMYGIEYSTDAIRVWAFFSSLEMILLCLIILFSLADKYHII